MNKVQVPSNETQQTKETISRLAFIHLHGFTSTVIG